jgi:hypothetical protein
VREVLLEGNSDIVTLDYVNKGALHPDPMPRVGPNYKKILPLERYCLNTETGRIKKGKSWIKSLGVRKCCEIDFRIIDPDLSYTDLARYDRQGRDLIRSKKIELRDFEISEFRILENSFPY